MDRQYQSVLERITAADLNEISTVVLRDVMRNLIVPLLVGTPENYRFNSGTFQNGIWEGMGTLRTGANTVAVNPGIWVGFDSAITAARDNPVQVGRMEAVGAGITIPNTSGGGFARWDTISVPYTRALLETDADSETRNFKNPATNQFTASTTPKRKTLAITNATRTAGSEVATPGAYTDAATTPAGHLRIAVVKATNTGVGSQADVYDSRVLLSIKPPLFKAQDWSPAAANAYTSGANILSGFAIPKAGFRINGAGGGADPVIRDSFNIKPNGAGVYITNNGTGVYEFDLHRNFVTNTKIAVSMGWGGTPADKQAWFQPGTGSRTHVIQVTTAWTTPANMAVDTELSVFMYGEQS